MFYYTFSRHKRSWRPRTKVHGQGIVAVVTNRQVIFSFQSVHQKGWQKSVIYVKIPDYHESFYFSGYLLLPRLTLSCDPLTVHDSPIQHHPLQTVMRGIHEYHRKYKGFSNWSTDNQTIQANAIKANHRINRAKIQYQSPTSLRRRESTARTQPPRR